MMYPSTYVSVFRALRAQRAHPRAYIGVSATGHVVVHEVGGLGFCTVPCFARDAEAARAAIESYREAYSDPLDVTGEWPVAGAESPCRAS
jgi:hypothetical protein